MRRLVVAKDVDVDAVVDLLDTPADARAVLDAALPPATGPTFADFVAKV